MFNLSNRNRLLRKRRNPWHVLEHEPVVVTGIQSILQHNPTDKISKLLHYWIEIKATGKIPSRDIVSVFQVAGLLPYVWLIDVERVPTLRFRFGLIKTHVHRANAIEASSRYFDEIEPKSETSMLCDYFRRAVMEERPLFRRGRPILPWRGNFQLQQSLYLPLAGNGRQVDAILAMSQFRDSAGRWQ